MSKQKSMSDICRTCPTCLKTPPGFIIKSYLISNRINPVRESQRDTPMSDMSDKCPTTPSKQPSPREKHRRHLSPHPPTHHQTQKRPHRHHRQPTPPQKPAPHDTHQPAPHTSKITHMPPVMDRKSSTQRCRDGWELRCRGRTWQEIADQLGYKSHHNAYAAVTRWLHKNPPDDLHTLRRATGDTLRHLATRLADEAHHALDEGQRTEAATLARAALDGLDRYAKLTGQHIPVEVNVNVNAVQALADTRARLIETIDAEFVEQPAIESGQS